MRLVVPDCVANDFARKPVSVIGGRWPFIRSFWQARLKLTVPPGGSSASILPKEFESCLLYSYMFLLQIPNQSMSANFFPEILRGPQVKI